MAAIKIEKLRKEYKDLVAVNDLDLEINEGELFALLGVNGAGKTTTIKMLSTLTKPSGGNAWVAGHSIVENPENVKGAIDVSMQETSVARKLTVRENIEFYAKLNGYDKQGVEEEARYLYEVFGLGEYKDKQAAKLSGGWQRKLSIALALISHPKVLFLDEPTLGLDVIARRELWAVIRALKSKMTIVLTTHYMEEAEALADRIGIMKQGKLLFVGDKETLYAQTQTASVEDAFIKIITGEDNHA